MGNGLKLLQVGQMIRIQQLEFSCNLTILPAGETGLKVVEVGVDYVILDEEADGVRTQIPMHVIKAVIAPASAETAVESVVEVAAAPVVETVAAETAPVPAPAAVEAEPTLETSIAA